MGLSIEQQAEMVVASIRKATIRELAEKLVVNECFKLFTKDPDEIERWLLEILDDS
jgi:hypothetical protein